MATQANQTAGIKISQPGVDVTTAADYQLIFNSSWPSLVIGFDKTVTVGAGSTLTVPHNLGFRPLTFGWFISNNVSTGRVMPGFQPAISIGLNNIYLANTDAVPYIVNLKCYNIDLTNQADYTLPQPPVISTPYDPNIGIKVTKFGKTMGSNDLRDYILNSQAQSPAVLSVITDKSGTVSSLSPSLSQITYSNPAGYVPWIYGFNSSTTTIYESLVYFQSGYAIQAATGLSINQPTITSTTTLAQAKKAVTTISLTYAPPGGATLVVLRDPLVLPNTVQVTY